MSPLSQLPTARRRDTRQARPRPVGPLLAGLLVLGAAACGSTEPNAAPATTSSSSAGGSTTVAAADATTTTLDSTEAAAGGSTPPTAKLPAITTTKPGTPATAARPPSKVLVLQANGLGAVSFGDSSAEVIDTLTAELGAPSSDSNLSECGGGADRGVQWSDLSATFMADKLVGYFYGSPTGAVTNKLSTATGITVGATVSDLTSAYPDATISTSTLGPEWNTTAGLNGFLTATDSAGKVVGVFAGDACFAR